MKIILDIPDYDGDSIDVVWEDGSNYFIMVNDNNVVLSANNNALVSIAKQMLYFAYNNLPQGSHIHYDSFFTKMNIEKYELIIEKRES